MYGAVLWSDRCNGRALIWCEDHGNLAFFNSDADNDVDDLTFEEGDLVRFKVRDGQGMRLAFEVTVVSAEEYPSLAAGLRTAASAPRESNCGTPDGQAGRGKIVPFDPGAKDRDRPAARKLACDTMAS